MALYTHHTIPLFLTNMHESTSKTMCCLHVYRAKLDMDLTNGFTTGYYVVNMKATDLQLLFLIRLGKPLFV